METSLFVICAATVGMAMVPVVELRGAIPFGVAMGLPPIAAWGLAVLGNMIPVPAIILFARTFLRRLHRFPWWGEKIDRLEKRTHLKGRLVRKYRLLGLVLLVAVPLPGTGAWTGALVATILRIRIRDALLAIFLGVVIAASIMTGVSCGVISLVWG